MRLTSVLIGVAFVTFFLGGSAVEDRAFAAGEEQEPDRVAWTLEALMAECHPDQGWSWKDTGPRKHFPDQHLWTVSNPNGSGCQLQVVANPDRVLFITMLIFPGSKDTEARLYKALTLSGMLSSKLTGMPSDRVAIWMRWCLEDDMPLWVAGKSGVPQAVEYRDHRISWQSSPHLGGVLLNLRPIELD